MTSSALAGRRATARLQVSAGQLSKAPWYVPSLVAAARARLEAAGAEPAADGGRPVLEIDLSGVPPVGCEEIVFLVGVLRRALGPQVELRLVGLTPALAAPLIGGGVGEDVVVVDSRGRCWSGRPDAVRPGGTWP